MTRPVPVAIAAPGLPLADPVDRATYAARKLEHLRWEKENLAPGALALAQVAKDNADDAYATSQSIAADAVAVAANTDAVASYANAAIWVTGTTYAIGDVRYAPANRQIYRRLTAGAGAIDPSLDGTNWAPVFSQAARNLYLYSLYGAL